MAHLLGQLHVGFVQFFCPPNYIYITLLAIIIADKTIIRDVFKSNKIIISTFALYLMPRVSHPFSILFANDL